MTTLSADSGANAHSFSSSPSATFRSSRSVWPVTELAEERLDGIQNTCPKGTQTEGRRSAWQGIRSLPQASFVFDFFLFNSTENFRILVSPPRKIKPHTLGCFLVTDFMTIGQSSASGRSPVEARPWLFLTWTFATPIHNRYDFTILKAEKPDPTLLTIETQPSFFSASHPFLCRTHLSVFGVPPSRSARPQIQGNRGQ